MTNRHSGSPSPQGSAQSPQGPKGQQGQQGQPAPGSRKSEQSRQDQQSQRPVDLERQSHTRQGGTGRQGPQQGQPSSPAGVRGGTSHGMGDANQSGSAGATRRDDEPGISRR